MGRVARRYLASPTTHTILCVCLVLPHHQRGNRCDTNPVETKISTTCSTTRLVYPTTRVERRTHKKKKNSNIFFFFCRSLRELDGWLVSLRKFRISSHWGRAQMNFSFFLHALSPSTLGKKAGENRRRHGSLLFFPQPLNKIPDDDDDDDDRVSLFILNPWVRNRKRIGYGSCVVEGDYQIPNFIKCQEFDWNLSPVDDEEESIGHHRTRQVGLTKPHR